jgi:UDP-3-O-[3-hydroxymyristoyl] N-acetylglucosamine deacetylase
VFRRTDLDGVEVSATWQNAIETPLCTTLVSADGHKISTIEHLMSAFMGCGIDNALVEVDGPEVPIMDGSASPFVFLIDCAGLIEQDAPKRAIRILKSVTAAEPHRAATLKPYDGFSVDFEIEFDHPLVRKQKWYAPITGELYRRDIARARTFGFLHEIDKLRAMGLARGGSLKNAVVIGEDSVLNDEGLRFPDELVRHKVLDSIGDLLLIGGPLLGHFSGDKAGHALTLRLLNRLFDDDTAWEWCDLSDESIAGGSGALLANERAVAAPS